MLANITNIIEESQLKKQAGFRSHFLTTDHIHVARQVLEKFSEYGKQYYIVF